MPLEAGFSVRGERERSPGSPPGEISAHGGDDDGKHDETHADDAPTTKSTSDLLTRDSTRLATLVNEAGAAVLFGVAAAPW